MSELSDAIERAQKRLDKMTEVERFKYHPAILREELARGPAASVDTLPKGRDAKQGSVRSKGSAVVATGDETPND